MMKLKTLLIGFLAVVALGACKKERVDQYDFAGNMAKDDAIIQQYLEANNLTADYQKDESGVYYKIIKPGTEDVTFKVSSLITANYSFRLLGEPKIIQSTGAYNETELKFEADTPAILPFNNGIIPGFRIGVTYLKKGGIVSVLIPSPLGYADDNRYAEIPPNSILDYTIELKDVQ